MELFNEMAGYPFFGSIGSFVGADELFQRRLSFQTQTVERPWIQINYFWYLL